jgi:hypothetical protein
MCKCGNVLSLPVLIGRAAWPQNNSHDRFEYLGFVLKKQIADIINPEITFFGGYS